MCETLIQRHYRLNEQNQASASMEVHSDLVQSTPTVSTASLKFMSSPLNQNISLTGTQIKFHICILQRNFSFDIQLTVCL